MNQIICAGLRRSGSTWLFNILLTLCKQTHLPAEVIKKHKLKDFTTNHTVEQKIFITIRDFREVVASCMRRNLLNQPLNQIVNDFSQVVNFKTVDSVRGFLRLEKRNFYNWKAIADLIIPYTIIESNKQQIIHHVCECLQITADCEQIEELVSKIEIPTQYDKATELWPNHITHNKINVEVDPQIIEMIKNEFPEFLNENLPKEIIDTSQHK